MPLSTIGGLAGLFCRACPPGCSKKSSDSRRSGRPKPNNFFTRQNIRRTARKTRRRLDSLQVVQVEDEIRPIDRTRAGLQPSMRSRSRSDQITQLMCLNILIICYYVIVAGFPRDDRGVEKRSRDGAEEMALRRGVVGAYSSRKSRHSPPSHRAPDGGLRRTDRGRVAVHQPSHRFFVGVIGERISEVRSVFPPSLLFPRCRYRGRRTGRIGGRRRPREGHRTVPGGRSAPTIRSGIGRIAGRPTGEERAAQREVGSSTVVEIRHSPVLVLGLVFIPGPRSRSQLLAIDTLRARFGLNRRRPRDREGTNGDGSESRLPGEIAILPHVPRPGEPLYGACKPRSGRRLMRESSKGVL